MKRWLKVGVALAGAFVVLMILAPRLWVKHSRVHLTVDGRVTTDYKVYFGPNGRVLLRIGAKRPRQVFVYTGAGTEECAPSEFLFPPFVAVGKRAAPQCRPTQPAAGARDNKLEIIAVDGRRYEVTWQPPPR